MHGTGISRVRLICRWLYRSQERTGTGDKIALVPDNLRKLGARGVLDEDAVPPLAGALSPCQAEHQGI